MFKRLRRYLLFLCVFTFVTTNIADLGFYLGEEALEAASVDVSDEEQEAASEELERSEDIDEAVSCSSDEWSEDGQLEVRTEETKESDCSIFHDEEDVLCDTSLEMVSYYIHTYQKLPPVYITKKQALQLGWAGGSIESFSGDKSIGGDYFGNYQKILPIKEGRSYHECDIDTLGAENRGRKRLVYSNDGLMYYTEDHYRSFTLLYSEWESKNIQNI